MVMVVDIKVFFFYILTFVTTFRSCKFEVYNTVDGKDNQEEKTGEGVDIRMYHFSLNFLQLGCDKLW